MIWVAIVAVGVGSFVFRLVPLLALQRISLSERSDRTIRHAGLAAIAALVVVAIQQSATGTGLLPTLVAMPVAVLLAARGASMARLLVCGGAIYAGCVIAVDLLAR